jgi:hypothetical protein
MTGSLKFQCQPWAVVGIQTHVDEGYNIRMWIHNGTLKVNGLFKDTTFNFINLSRKFYAFTQNTYAV